MCYVDRDSIRAQHRLLPVVVVILVVVQRGHVHVGVDVVGDVVVDPLVVVVRVLVAVAAVVVVDILELVQVLRLVLFLLRLADPPLFSFLDEPVLVVILALAPLPRRLGRPLSGHARRGL